MTVQSDINLFADDCVAVVPVTSFVHVCITLYHVYPVAFCLSMKSGVNLPGVLLQDLSSDKHKSDNGLIKLAHI